MHEVSNPNWVTAESLDGPYHLGVGLVLDSINCGSCSVRSGVATPRSLGGNFSMPWRVPNPLKICMRLHPSAFDAT